MVLIGGMHGGYEWNTVSLAYETIDYFTAHERSIPDEVSLYIIPCANPDGLAAITGHPGRFSPKHIPKETDHGRFNAKGVDLNRNWDCNWQSVGKWRKKTVDCGTAPFSETETLLLKKFLTEPMAHAVVFWHSAYPGVFAGHCDSTAENTLRLAEIYSKASGYPYRIEYLPYLVTGDASDWLDSKGIPAINVELTNHTNTELKRNLKGIQGVLEFLKQAP